MNKGGEAGNGEDHDRRPGSKGPGKTGRFPVAGVAVTLPKGQKFMF